MRFPILLSLIVLAICSCVQNDQAAETITEADARTFVEAYDKAWNAKDTAAVSAMLDREYVYFTSKGGLSRRIETIRFLGDTSYVIHDAKRSEIMTMLTGNVATVSSRWVGELAWKAQPIHDNQRCGQILVKRNGKVLMVAEHCVEITE